MGLRPELKPYPKYYNEVDKMTLVILGTEVKEVPIKPKEVEFDKVGKKTKYTDKDGKVVDKVTLQSSEYKWVYEDGTEYTGKAYKNIKGKPYPEFKKTTLIAHYDEISKDDMKYFIENEHTYLLISDKLKEQIKALDKDNKMIAFKYVIRGFKIYKAVVYYDSQLDKCLMRCFRGDLRTANLDEHTDKPELEATELEEADIDAFEV